MLTPRELRHDLHQHPELSLHEHRTTRVIKNNVEELFKKFSCDFSLLQPLETGLIIDYNPVNSDYILLRADIDALPIKEKSGAKFHSLNDNMHACGHDLHTAILYGVLQYVLKNQIQQNIIFLFQPAEEENGGAQKILDSGVLDKYNISEAFALHVTDEYKHGILASRPRVLFASSLELDIHFSGRSSHIAFPDQGRNALLALTNFLNQVDSIVGEKTNEAVLGFGQAKAGKARNIIARKAQLMGTLRTSTMEKADYYVKRLEDVLCTIQKSTGVDYELQKGAQYREVYNDPILFQKFRYSLPRNFSFIQCSMKMTAEDFGYFTEQYPAVMLWLGTRKGEHQAGLHNPKFCPSDDIIDTGIEVYKTLLNM
ncbi:MAG TPA: amidohydrolase [bacterium]|nr:amidohydrolase [bacterium]